MSPRNSLLSLLAAASLSVALLAPARAADPPGTAKVGFVFVAKPSVVRESPDVGGKELAKVPVGLRLVYRRVVEANGAVAWYRVEPPGGAAGWVAAKEMSDKRPGNLPPAKPVKVEDSGISVAGSSSSQTAAARGLSKAAVEFAADRKQLKRAADEFITLEHQVEKIFDDPHDSNGDYPDVDVPGRASHAAKFKEGIQ